MVTSSGRRERSTLQDPARTPTVALLALALGLTVALLELGVMAYASERIGVESRYLFTLLALSLLGANVDIPLGGPPEADDEDDGAPRPTVLAVNLGGAVIPSALSAYLLVYGGAPLAALAGVAIVAVVVHRIARPDPRIGITVPIFVPPLVAAAVGWLLAPAAAPAVAYVAGTLGTLIGADLTNLRTLRGMGAPLASIGGAGTFDGIFVTGILAVLLA